MAKKLNYTRFLSDFSPKNRSSFAKRTPFCRLTFMGIVFDNGLFIGL
jgi:hypothetical protein